MRHRDGGFTLVEVLAAVLILSIGLMALVSAMSASRDTQLRILYTSLAQNIAKSRMEELCGSQMAGLNSMVGTTQTSDSSLPTGNQITTTVAQFPPGDSSQFRLRVDVRWPEGKGTRTITYESIVTQY